MIYYAHSKRSYDTKKELEELKLIADTFPKEKIYNPNNASISGAYNPMKACYSVIEKNGTTKLIFSTYKNYIGKGVYCEIQLAQKLGTPVYLLDKNNIALFEDRLKVIDIDWAVKYAKILKKAPERPMKEKWFSVKKDLPPEDTFILISIKYPNPKYSKVTTGKYIETEWFDYLENAFCYDDSFEPKLIYSDYVTHWRYMPELATKRKK